MPELTVIDRGNHCEIHQGDSIAADYVASRRIANLFAAAPELLAALCVAEAALSAYSGGESADLEAIRAAIAKAEGEA